MMSRSLNVPGSDSSALQTKYFGLALCLGMKPHFTPVGKPAPPRPRRFDAFIWLMMSSWVIESAFLAAVYPSIFFR